MARSAENSVWGAVGGSAAGGRINATLTAVTLTRKTRTIIAAVSRFMTVSPQRTIRTHSDNAAAGSTRPGDRKRVRPRRVRGKGPVAGVRGKLETRNPKLGSTPSPYPFFVRV